MTRFKRVMYYLGLSADEEYASYEETIEPPTEGFTYENEPSDMEPLSLAPPTYNVGGTGGGGITPKSDSTGFHPLSPNSPTVRPMPQGQTPKVQVLTPHSFQEVKEIGENLRREQPIIINLQETQQDISRRIVDFASGVCFALGGQMERVADLVYLLAPPDVEINPEDHQHF